MIVSCPFNRSFPRLLFPRELSGLFTPTFINYSCGVAGRRRSNEEGGERGSVAVGIVGQKGMESLACSSFVSFTLSFLPPASCQFKSIHTTSTRRVGRTHYNIIFSSFQQDMAEVGPAQTGGQEGVEDKPLGTSRGSKPATMGSAAGAKTSSAVAGTSSVTSR